MQEEHKLLYLRMKAATEPVKLSPLKTKHSSVTFNEKRKRT